MDCVIVGIRDDGSVRGRTRVGKVDRERQGDGWGRQSGSENER